MSIILHVNELKEKLADGKSNITVIDVRTKDKQFQSGKEAYVHSHIPGAVFLDIKKDLTGKDSFLPDVVELERKLSCLGVSNDTTLVFYDQGNHRAASKAWFVMDYVGHENSYILQGGFPAWVEDGNGISETIPERTPTTYQVYHNEELVVDIAGIKQRIVEQDSVLIDSRAYERYAGKVEPKYKKAGHIPGAKNFHSKHVFDENGLWKKKEDLQSHFSSLNEQDEIIVSCGSGNSACMNIVALKEAGYKDVKLYPGGFSEWIADENNEVVTEDE